MMLNNWQIANDRTIREVERATAQRVGWHLREVELAREERAERKVRMTRLERPRAWLARLAQAAASWAL